MNGLIAVLIDRSRAGRYTNPTLDAIEHALSAADADIRVREVPTASIDTAIVSTARALLVGPGSPYERPDLVHAAIRYARERGVPLVGT